MLENIETHVIELYNTWRHIKGYGNSLKICVYELGVASKRAAGAFFSSKKDVPGVVRRCKSWKVKELSEFQYFWIRGPVWKDARQKIINFGGTQTSRSPTTTRLMTKTMNGQNPLNVLWINLISLLPGPGTCSHVSNVPFGCAPERYMETSWASKTLNFGPSFGTLGHHLGVSFGPLSPPGAHCGHF